LTARSPKWRCGETESTAREDGAFSTQSESEGALAASLMDLATEHSELLESEEIESDEVEVSEVSEGARGGGDSER